MPRWFPADDISPAPLETRRLVDHLARYRLLYLAAGAALLAIIARAANMSLSDMEGFWWLSLPLAIIVLPRLLPRALRIQQILQDTVVYLLLAATAAGTLAACDDIFDRVSDERLNQLVKQATVAAIATPRNGFLAAAVILAACILLAIFLRSRRTRQRPCRIQLLLALLLALVAMETVSVPAAFTRVSHNPGEFLGELGPAWFASYLGVLLLFWSWCALLLLVGRQQLAVTIDPASEASPADKYVSASSSVALSALVVAFFGLNTCWGYAQNLDRLIDIRGAFAKDLVAAVFAHHPALIRAVPTTPHTPDTDFQAGEASAAAIVAAWPTDPLPERPAWIGSLTLTPTGFQHHTFLGTEPTGVAFTVQVQEVDLPGAWVAAPVLDLAADLHTNHTLTAAAPCVDKLDASDTYDKVYWACETASLKKGVKFPFVDVDFPIQYVLAATFLALTGCLIVLSDRIQALIEMPPSTHIEPWILLDATRPGSRLLANGWVLLLVTAPWLLIAVAVRIVSLQVRAEGSVSTVTHDAVFTAAILAGLAASIHLSRSLFGALITLRQVRRYQFLAAASKVTPPAQAELPPQ